MSWILGICGALVLLDVYDKAGDTFTQKQEWQLGIGIVLVILAVIVYVWKDSDE